MSLGNFFDFLLLRSLDNFDRSFGENLSLLLLQCVKFCLSFIELNLLLGESLSFLRVLSGLLGALGI